VGNWVNWLLLIGGGICILAELMLGAATGFDLALLGGAIGAGGVLGLLFGSTAVGLFSAGALAFIYLAFLRRAVRRRLTPADRPSNVDALVGRTGTVTARIAPHNPGQAKFGDEIWRAELLRTDDPPREIGQTVTVAAVEGVTLKVR
jgi:membrane protein implicated in regulation of membrane protease activity